MSTGLERAGDRLGRYVIERRLAVGGMAELFLARLEGPEDFSKRVVIKRILPRLRDNHQFGKMFADEARLAARFSHPNLVQVFELVENDGEYLLVMEYVDGKDVGALLKRCHRERVLIPIRIATYLVGQIAQGLHAAHELTRRGKLLNVIHRDISPENILITRLGGVKVIDFGIAKHESRQAETVVGTVKGKVAYMSPEQLLKRPLDRRSDIFSLGVVFYELLTGEQCFKGESALQQMMAVEKAQYKPVHALRAKVPPDVEAVVDRMLALRPQDRFETAREVVVAIERLMSKYGTVLSNDLEEYVAPMFEPEDDEPEPHEAAPRRQTLGSSPHDERWESEVFEAPSPTGEEPAVLADEVTVPNEVPDAVEPIEIPAPASPPLLESVAPAGARASSTRRFRAVAIALFGAVLLLFAAARWLWSGILEVRTIPPGATVMLEGQELGESPVRIPRLRPGVVYEVEVHREGFERQSRRVVVEREEGEHVELIHLDAAPPPGAGVLTVTSEPPGAEIRVAGRSEVEVAPARFVLTADRLHEVSAQLEGYSEAKLEVKLTDGERESRRLMLMSSFAIVSLRVEPAVTVLLGDEKLGRTPLDTVKVPAGANELWLVNDSLGIKKQVALDLPPGENRTLEITLEKGELLFDAKPWADVYVDGKKVGTTPMLPLMVYEGSHEVRFVNPSMNKDETVTAVVNAGDATRVSAGWDP